MPTLFNKEVKFPLGGRKGKTFTIVSMQAYTTIITKTLFNMWKR